VGEIGRIEGRILLGRSGAGRVIHTFRALPAVTVSDYAVAGGVLHFTAEADSRFADSVRDCVIGFHVEHVDASGASGWSVTVFGPARAVAWPGPPGVQDLLRPGPGERDEELFGLALTHLSGQSLVRRPVRATAPARAST
jgi:hypothetical protein